MKGSVASIRSTCPSSQSRVFAKMQVYSTLAHPTPSYTGLLYATLLCFAPLHCTLRYSTTSLGKSVVLLPLRPLLTDAVIGIRGHRQVSERG